MRQDVVQPMDISRIVKSWPRFWPLLALITVLGLSVAPAQAQTLADLAEPWPSMQRATSMALRWKQEIWLRRSL